MSKETQTPNKIKPAQQLMSLLFLMTAAQQAAAKPGEDYQTVRPEGTNDFFVAIPNGEVIPPKNTISKQRISSDNNVDKILQRQLETSGQFVLNPELLNALEAQTRAHTQEHQDAIQTTITREREAAREAAKKELLAKKQQTRAEQYKATRHVRHI